jgi:hypothetical protein
MKTAFYSIAVLACLATGLGQTKVQAGNSDVEIHCVAKKLDEKVNQGSGEGSFAVTKEHWIYEVTIENKTFKDLANLEVKYVIFFNKEQVGVKAAPTPRRQAGTAQLDSLKSHEKRSFTTDPVELDKANLVGNYYYASGAKTGAHDTLTGLGVRVMQAGQQFAEYANPSTLLREKWE